MKKLLSIILLIAMPVMSMAQIAMGKIIDEVEQPVAYANIVSLSLPDSAFIAGTISDMDGCFRLDGEKNANLFLKISSVGYETVFLKCTVADMGMIKLNTDTQLLGEVVVKGNLPQTRLKNGALITNVQNSVLGNLGSANDVLAKIPGLQGKEGNFTVFGKGEPLFYINGRLVRDKSELQQLHSSEIKSVEVITNPGAQYDATVKSVVLIRTLKLNGEGIGGNLETSHMYGKHYFGVNQFDFNYRRKGLDVLGSLFYSGGQDGTNSIIDQQTFVDTLWTQHSVSNTITKRDNYKARLGMNYMFSEEHSIGILYDFVYRTTDEPNNLMNSEILANGKPYDSWKSLSTIGSNSPIHSVNMYYVGNIKKLSVNFNTDMRWSYQKQNQTTDEYSENYNSRTVTTKSRYDNGLTASKLTLGIPIWKGNFSFGGEYTHTYQKNRFENMQGILSDMDNEVKEKNMATFAEYRLPMGEKGSLEAGVRYEHNISDYYENGTLVAVQSKTYNNLFPFLSASYSFGKVSTQLSYSTKIQRPTYEQLDGNINYVNRFTYLSGNPLLKPTKLSDFTLVTSYDFIQFVASFQRMSDAIIYVTDQYANQSNVSHSTFANFDKIDKLSLILSASPTIGHLNMNYSVGLIKQWFQLSHLDMMKKMERPMPYLSLYSTYTFPLDFQVNVDFVYLGKGYANNMLIFENKYIDVGVGKSFLKNKTLLVRLECMDIFNWKRNNMHLYGARNIISEKDTWTDSRRIQLTCRYNFNSSKSKYKGTGAGNAEKERL